MLKFEHRKIMGTLCVHFEEIDRKEEYLVKNCELGILRSKGSEDFEVGLGIGSEEDEQ